MIPTMIATIQLNFSSHDLVLLGLGSLLVMFGFIGLARACSRNR